MAQDNFKPVVVWLILNGKTEEALELLAKNYKVNVPKLKVGLPKGHKITACWLLHRKKPNHCSFEQRHSGKPICNYP